MKSGMLDALLSNFILPRDEESLKDFKKLEQVFYKLINNIKYLETIFSQLYSFFKDYLKEKEQMLTMINQQYEPHLRQKEEALSKKLGKEVKIDPAQDPEYISIIRNNISELEGKYQSVLIKAKKDLFDTLKSEI